MANSSNNELNTNNPFEQVKSTDDITASNSLNRTIKRTITDNLDIPMKKIKLGSPLLEQKNPMPCVATNAQPNFVSAATMVTAIPEISDEELLEFTLEFERKHGI